MNVPLRRGWKTMAPVLLVMLLGAGASASAWSLDPLFVASAGLFGVLFVLCLENAGAPGIRYRWVPGGLELRDRWFRTRTVGPAEATFRLVEGEAADRWASDAMVYGQGDLGSWWKQSLALGQRLAYASVPLSGQTEGPAVTGFPVKYRSTLVGGLVVLDLADGPRVLTPADAPALAQGLKARGFRPSAR